MDSNPRPIVGKLQARSPLSLSFTFRFQNIPKHSKTFQNIPTDWLGRLGRVCTILQSISINWDRTPWPPRHAKTWQGPRQATKQRICPNLSGESSNWAKDLEDADAMMMPWQCKCRWLFPNSVLRGVGLCWRVEQFDLQNAKLLLDHCDRVIDTGNMIWYPLHCTTSSHG